MPFYYMIFFKGLRLVALICSMGFAITLVQAQAPAAGEAGSQQLWVTMHTAPIDDYCPPCIASERLLKEAHVEFKKVLEPLGPWPWFQLTDSRGNQRTLRGALSQSDVELIKRGEFPNRQ